MKTAAVVLSASPGRRHVIASRTASEHSACAASCTLRPSAMVSHTSRTASLGDMTCVRAMGWVGWGECCCGEVGCGSAVRSLSAVDGSSRPPGKAATCEARGLTPAGSPPS